MSGARVSLRTQRFSHNLISGKQPALAWNGHYGSEYAPGRMVKMGAPVNRGVCSQAVRAHSRSALWTCLDKASLQQTVQEWQMANTVFLGAPMHMQCKETHKCNQNGISRVRVMLSNFPSRVAKNCNKPSGVVDLATVRTLDFVSHGS